MDNYLMDLWEKTLDLVKNEITDVSFDTWIKAIEPVSIRGDQLYLCVPNDFTKGILEGRYTSLISNAVKKVTSQTYYINFVLTSEADKYMDKPEGTESEESNNDAVLNPKYTFDTFVIGNSNRFAHAASLAVAESPAKAYNPLFIYGGVGLGKTHLMHAIGHFILQNNTSSKVLRNLRKIYQRAYKFNTDQ